MMGNPLPLIREAKHSNGLRWTKEALRRSIERDIPAEELYVALNSPRAVLLRNSPTDDSPSCLILSWSAKNRPIHSVVAYARMLVITVYEPSLPQYVNPYERA